MLTSIMSMSVRVCVCVCARACVRVCAFWAVLLLEIPYFKSGKSDYQHSSSKLPHRAVNPPAYTKQNPHAKIRNIDIVRMSLAV